jgi:hypothetical protein
MNVLLFFTHIFNVLFTRSSIVGFIFQIINVGILVGIIIYVFNKYLRVAIVSLMNSLKKQNNDLKKQSISIQHYKDGLEVEMNEWVQKSIILRQKIALWRNKQEAFINNHNEYRNELNKAIGERVARQEEHLMIVYAQRAVVPQAVSVARERLTTIFKQSKNVQEYDDKLINKVRGYIHESKSIHRSA